MSTADAAPPLLRMSGVVKTFAGTTALAGAEFALDRGEVHALVGENGAGKSTLLNTLAGVFPPDEGSIRVDGVGYAPGSPAAAAAAGVAVVHQ